MTGRERVANKPLSGDEIKSAIRADFNKLLDNEGLLSSYIAHGRVAYDVILRLHMDNPFNPESESHIASVPATITNPSPELVVAEDRVSRSIDSPNAERLRMGMPVPVEVKQQDGTITTEQIKYPPQPELGDGNLKLEYINPNVSSAAAPDVPVAVRMGKCGHSDHNVALSGLCTRCGREWIDAATPDPPPTEHQDWPANPPDKREAFYGGMSSTTSVVDNG
jgi:hypothetical protein